MSKRIDLRRYNPNADVIADVSPPRQLTVPINATTVACELYMIDGRSRQQRQRNQQQGHLDGNLIVIVPGHGQTIHAPLKLAATAVYMSRSKLVWTIDPVPAPGGDPQEAMAIAAIIRQHLLATFPDWQQPVPATIMGWSHGGSEALRAANFDPDLFPQYLGLCPTGLVEKRPFTFLKDFFQESTRLLWRHIRQQEWHDVADSLRLGGNAASGIVQDMWRSRSVKRVYEDILWAAKKVSDPPLSYPGEIALLFGEEDSLIRWRDLFPELDNPMAIRQVVTQYQRDNFPEAKKVRIDVLPGAHNAPEINAWGFLQAGLQHLHQLDEHVIA